jgi:hypothetical protein
MTGESNLLRRRRRAAAGVVALLVALGVAGTGSVAVSGPAVPPVQVAKAPDGPVVGDAPVDARTVGGDTGQDLVVNFPRGEGGPEGSSHVARNLWWSWTAPTTAPVRFTTHGSELDTVLRVREGSAEGRLVASNDDEGDVATSAVTVDAVAGQEYSVEVSAAGDEAPEESLVQLTWEPAPQAVAEAPPAVEQQLTVSSIPVAGNTGEKPQSKTWSHAGTWWTVLASTATTPRGTWVWRQDPTTGSWSNVLQVSDRTDVRADVHPDGDDLHVLLHGPVSSLVSLRYDPATAGYGTWPGRAAATVVSLPQSETATLDVDSTGRMWVVWDTDSAIQARYADAPYATFSDLVTIATGIQPDDIGAVRALPGGRIGVLWSNQSTRRFGFRTHVDGASPTTWTADEVPAGSSALNVGGGMADDHLNLAVASDGTLYAAVKTSYDSSSQTVVGLLVRHPDGTWDPMRRVDTRGTRPVVQIDEATGRLRVVYTASTELDDILEKETSLAAPTFTGQATTVMDGRWNNPSGSRTQAAGATQVAAASSSAARVARLTWVDPSAPQARDASFSTQLGEPVVATLPGSSPDGEPLRFEIVQAPATGQITALDPATGAFTYTPGPDQGIDSFTYRVGAGGEWSQPGVVTVRVGDGDGLVGAWDFDEGTGLVATDASGWHGDGLLRGGTQRVDGADGSGAVSFDGSTGYVEVPDSPVLDTTEQLTVAARVRVDTHRSQYVVKKAIRSTVDGWAIGLSSTGRPYLRLAKATQDDRYQAEAATSVPADGATWVHLAGTYDGSTVRLYVDGVLAASVAGPTSVPVNDLPLTIGADANGDRSLDGAVDAVRVFDRGLDAA